MVSYKIEISSSAEKQIKKLQKDDQVRVMRSVLNLSRDPRPHGCRKMKGFDNIYRIRVGVFRVIYSVEEKRIVVVILKVGHRKQVYRQWSTYANVKQVGNESTTRHINLFTL